MGVVGARFEFLDWPGPLAFAHRGGGHERPENSLEAFDHAVALGYRYLETDVQVTRDGRLVAHHDPFLDPRDGPGRFIAELTWSEVRQVRLRDPQGEPTEQRITLLEDLMGTYPEARFNIDAKVDRAVAPLAELISRLGATGRVCLASFSDARVRELRSLLGPELCTSGGPLDVARIRLGPLGRLFGAPKAACLQVPTQRRVRGPLAIPIVEPRFLRRVAEVGLSTHVWTVDDPDEMHRLLDLGVHGLMTDRPSVLKEVLVERGEWS
ncbi:MAG: glycerophosphodiester phosphodiesterase [Acidimicrobiia bacterium]|nr:glycerophosphodiester phosphodiesterase [Acidimicrobiia bacterium]